ncbi:MAG TPA: hypothetical protein VHN81_08340 [Edaphobacter sp.]|nr:hypothetical protein [Edaphobacter sp.]
MNPVLWGGVVVVLLIAIAGVTMAKTRWGRSELNERPAGLPRNHGRVSGHEDD